MKIRKVVARQILDSRGNPTIEADVILENGHLGRASVPSGASTGTNEALELRDNDPKIYLGKSVLEAISNVKIIASKLKGFKVTDQEKIDQIMIDLDGTPNKEKLGANAILAVSIACAKAAAQSLNMPLFQYFAKIFAPQSHPKLLPTPQMNLINGGAHASFATDIQEFMIMPTGAKTFTQALLMGAEVFQTLKKILKDSGFPTTVGDEGGFALRLPPNTKNANSKALDFLILAIEKAGYKLGKDICLALDLAASEFYKDGKYNLATEARKLSADQMIDWIEVLVKKYPIISVEDGLAQDDWDGWNKLNKRLGSKIQLIGDDLLVTNTSFLKKAIKEKSANAILIKLNQIGTVTETFAAIKMAKKTGWKIVISHRSGETEDTTIADLAVGVGAGQIKTGSLSRTDRIAKYNQLLRIEEILGKKAKYQGKI